MNRIVCSFIQKIIERLGGIVAHNGVRVYMFHRVNDTPERTDEKKTISTSSFNAFIEKKLLEGYTFISAKEIASIHKKKVCIVTFDDIYEDAFLNAFPYLEKKGVPYFCFISPGFIGRDEYISEDQLSILKKSYNCGLGAHGINHLIFKYLKTDEKIKEMEKKTHKSVLGEAIEDFAFPYGSLYACDRYSIKLARKAYKRVYTTFSMPFSNFFKHEKKGLLIPRINVNENNYKRV